jgi:hypothetical protein
MRFIIAIMVATTLLTRFAAKARSDDLILVPADRAANEQYLKIEDGDVIRIKGYNYSLKSIEKKSALTQKIFDTYVVPRINYQNAPLSEVLEFLQNGVIDTYMQLTESDFFFFSIRAAKPNGNVTIKATNAGLKAILERIAKQTSSQIRITGSQILFVKKDE